MGTEGYGKSPLLPLLPLRAGQGQGQEERYALTFGVMEQDPFLGQAARLSVPTQNV